MVSKQIQFHDHDCFVTILSFVTLNFKLKKLNLKHLKGFISINRMLSLFYFLEYVTIRTFENNFSKFFSVY